MFEFVQNWGHGNETLLLVVALISLVVFVVGLLVTPVVVVRLPADYFLRESNSFDQRSQINLLRRILKNLLGVLLVFSGFVMLFLPGPGVMVLLIGLALMDFPGKRKLLVKLLLQPKVSSVINRLRQKRGEAPLILETENND